MNLIKHITRSIRYIKKSSVWVKLIILCVCIIIFVNLFKRIENRVEGFTLNSDSPKYVMKNDDLYDKFYSDIYDELVFNPKKNDYEITNLLKNIKLKDQDKILDIGCGTGHHVEMFNKKGFNCTGLDKSSHMIKKCKENYPTHNFTNNDALKSITFPGESFNLISLFYFTIYYIKDKRQLFQNCMFWLKPNGYLVLHLVDRDNFDPIIPAGNPFVLISPQNYAKERITSSVVKFNNFTYKAKFDLDNKNSLGKFRETMKFKKNNKIRENEHVFYMETQKQILSIAKEAGFILKAKIDLSRCQYDNQFLYILYKS